MASGMRGFFLCASFEIDTQGGERAAQILNDSTEMGVIREDLLHTDLLSLLKPGKNHTKIYGYSRIAMQNISVNTQKKLVAWKLDGK